MAAKFVVDLKDVPESVLTEGGPPLRALCRKEAEAFSRWLQQSEPLFPDGLADWEIHAIALYLEKASRKVFGPKK